MKHTNITTVILAGLLLFCACGEGAGYSGGIVSSAIDGIRCAEAVFNV